MQHRLEAIEHADVVADRPAEIAHEIVSFLGEHPADAPRADLPAEGVYQGITWKKQGAGPALLLLTLYLSRWAGDVEAWLVRRVARMVDLAEYKRRQSPPGIKITPRAFGKDRRLPITNGWREQAPR